MRPPLDLNLPRTRRWSWWVVAFNVAIHGLLALYTIGPWQPRRRDTDRVQLIALPVPSEGPRAVEMIYLAPVEGQGTGQREGVTLTRPPERGVVPEVVVQQPIPELEPPEVLPDTGATPPVRPEPAPAVVPAPRGTPRLGPARGQGMLWVQPLPLPPRELAQRLSRSHLELVDSAVSAIVQAYIDSVVTSPNRPGAPLPSWTTDIGGQTFGLDSKYIYLGPLKIPAALLALLPIPGGGNMDLQEGRRMAAIRADLEYAVRRAETMDDFKKAIKEIRERREREREFVRNQRQRPPALPDTGRRS